MVVVQGGIYEYIYLCRKLVVFAGVYLFGLEKIVVLIFYFFFFFNDTAPTEIYPLPLHDALPISGCPAGRGRPRPSCRRTRWRSPGRPRRAGSAPRPTRRSHRRRAPPRCCRRRPCPAPDRKSTRLNSSHGYISYAVFCLKKKKRNT